MTRDPFDDLLDRSTPTTRPAAGADLQAMIAEARTQADPRRTSRVLVAGGVIAALLVTGVGTAAATDGFSWAPWAQNPVGAVPFTMNTTNATDSGDLAPTCETSYGFAGGVWFSFTPASNGVVSITPCGSDFATG